MDSQSRDSFAADAAVSGGSQRTRQRDSMFLMGRLRFAGEAAVRDVRVRNLSAGGLMVDCPRVMEPGTGVTLEVRGLGELGGKVAWCAEGRVGIALDQPIDPQRARKPVGGAAASSSPGFTVKPR